MSRGITVTNYLINGDPEGVIFAYLSNWSGQAIKIPRNLFPDNKSLPEINRPGVYFLFGQSPDNPDDAMVYTGEANNISERLVAHMRSADKIFFEDIICFTSKDDNLTVSHTKYLELKSIIQLNKSSSYRCVNSKAGDNINLSAMVKDEMDAFYDYMKIILPTIGYNVLQEEELSTTDIKKLFLKANKVLAKAVLTSNGIEVLAGSTLNSKTTQSISGSYVNLRNTLFEKEIIEEVDGELIFIKNYEFSSPSAAGAVILGYPVNGRDFWKDEYGKSLNQLEAESL